MIASFYTGDGTILQGQIELKTAQRTFFNGCEIQEEDVSQIADMGMIQTTEELQRLNELGAITRYNHFIDSFDSNLFNHPESIHGVTHMKRVLMHCLSLAHQMNLDESDTRVLCLCALWHDIGRVHDEEDTTHGDLGFEKVQKNNLIKQSGTLDLRVSKVLSKDDIMCIEFVVRHHCRSDKANEHLLTTQTPDHLHERLDVLWKVFKDADALDRVRIRDLDPHYLRFEQYG